MPRLLKSLSKSAILVLALGIVVSAIFRPSLLSHEAAELHSDLSGFTPATRFASPAPAELLTVPLSPSGINRPDPRGPLGFLCRRREARVFDSPPVLLAPEATGFVSVRTVLVLPFLLVVDADGARTVRASTYSYGVTHCSRAILLVLGPWPIRVGYWQTGVMWHGPGRSES